MQFYYLTKSGLRLLQYFSLSLIVFDVDPRPLEKLILYSFQTECKMLLILQHEDLKAYLWETVEVFDPLEMCVVPHFMLLIQQPCVGVQTALLVKGSFTGEIRWLYCLQFPVRRERNMTYLQKIYLQQALYYFYLFNTLLHI